jgi:Subtilase family
VPPAVPPVRLPPSRRVIVRFKPEVNLPYDSSAAEHLADQAGHAWSEIAGPHPGTRIGPLYPKIPTALLKSYSLLPPAVGQSPFRFLSDFAVDCPPGVVPADVADRIRTWASVRTAYVQAGAAPPPSSVMAHNDPLSALQLHLDPAPIGIDARWVWHTTPANGAGVGFVDLEQGWVLNHEDLAAAGVAAPLHGQDLVFRDHGANVLGVVRATDNNVGVVGIAPQCGVQVVSPWTCQFTPCIDHSSAGLEYHDHNVAQAIHAAIPAMRAGDVLLLETQYGTPDGFGGALPPYLPAEVDDVVYDAIRAAVTKGIVVVEAAANGTQDLDLYTKGGLNILNQTAGKDVFRDSGAILVAAAITVKPPTEIRAPHTTTNFGRRVDCFAWGQGVPTSGQESGSSSLNFYANNFGETSAAAAIVAGAAVLLQSWRIGTGPAPYTPDRLRELFRDTTLNTLSKAHPTDRIGVMPNLRAIITKERESLPEFRELPRRYHDDAARLLHGREGSVLRRMRELLASVDPAERDLVVGIAALDLAAQAERKSVAKRLRKTAQRILKESRKPPKRGR